MHGEERSMSKTVLASRVRIAAASAARPSMTGRVSKVVGLNLEVDGVDAAIGEAIAIDTGGDKLMAEVVAIRDSGLVCMPFGDLKGVRAGAPAAATGRPLTIHAGPPLLGRALDGLARPLDGGPALPGLPGIEEVTVDGTPPHPLRRASVNRHLPP